MNNRITNLLEMCLNQETQFVSVSSNGDGVIRFNIENCASVNIYRRWKDDLHILRDFKLKDGLLELVLERLHYTYEIFEYRYIAEYEKVNDLQQVFQGYLDRHNDESDRFRLIYHNLSKQDITEHYYRNIISSLKHLAFSPTVRDYKVYIPFTDEEIVDNARVLYSFNRYTQVQTDRFFVSDRRAFLENKLIGSLTLSSGGELSIFQDTSHLTMVEGVSDE